MIDFHDFSAVQQQQLKKLHDIRGNLNCSETETNGPELLGRLKELFFNWKGYLPNLRDIFGQDAVEHLLWVSVERVHSNESSEGRSFVNFVVSSGYKNEPDVDNNGRPVLLRETVLHHAASLNCDRKLVDHLFCIYDKFNVNYVDDFGRSHFHVACEYGLEYAVENFLEHGHNPNCVVACSRDSTLHLAMKCEYMIMKWECDYYKEVVELLLRSGADPNITNDKGETPLHIIAQKDYECEITQLFFQINDELNQLVRIDDRDTSGSTPLHVALKSEKKEVVKLLLRRGANSTLVNENGESPLHLICKKDSDVSLMELFFDVIENIGKTVQIDARDNEGNSPLHLSLEYEQKEAAELLLRNGADPNLPRAIDGYTPLHIICRKNEDGFMKTFFDINDANNRKVDIDAQDNDGNTPMYLALLFKFEKVAGLLLRRGADLTSVNEKGETPWYIICQTSSSLALRTLMFDILDEFQQTERINGQDKSGDTPLHLALRSRDAVVAKLLLRRGANLTLVNDKGETPLHTICKASLPTVTVELFFQALDEIQQQTEYINTQDKTGNTPLHWAMACGCNNPAEMLLRRGANLTLVNDKGETPLHTICMTSLRIDTVELFFQALDEIQQRTEYINTQDKTGNTPLHWALACGYNNRVEMLLRRGGDPTVTNHDGSTPLHVICGKNDVSLMELFFDVIDDLGQTVQIEARNKLGCTPLQLLVNKDIFKDGMVKLLLLRGADPHLANWPLFLHDFCRYGKIHLARIFFEVDGEKDPRVRIDAQDHEGNTPLHLALDNAHLKMAKFLLKRGADPILVNAKGETPLDIILSKKRETLEKWERLDDLTIVLKLIYKNADANNRTIQINTRDKLGNTPLHLILNNDLRYLAKVLLMRGADPTLVNAKGETPLDILCQNHRDDVDLMKMMFENIDENEKYQPVKVDALLQSAVANSLVKVTKFLLKRGADPTSANAKGETPLDIICKDRRDNLDLVRMMFKIVEEKDQVVNVDDLLQSAVASGIVKVTKLLLKRGANPHTRSSDGFSTLYQIFENFSDLSLSRIVSEMINKPNRPMPIDTRDQWGQHDTLLHLALRNGKKKTASLLLRRGADANPPNAEGETPLHMICHRNTVHLADLFFTSMEKRNQAVLIDAQNNLGDTPLHVALSHATGRRMAELLLSKGADSTLVNEAGETLLHVVCKVAQDGETAEMLFRMWDERGVELPLDARDNWGNTPLHNLAYAGHNENSTCELLLARGAEPSLTNDAGSTPLHITCDGEDIELVRTLLNHVRVRVDVRDREGNTALHLALERKHRAAAELLLSRGASPALINEKGETPLLIICKVGQDDDVAEVFYRIRDERHLQLAVDIADNVGNTPLKLAVARILPGVVDLLMNRGADVSRFDFPAGFGAGIDAGVHYSSDDRLIMACDFLAIVESLENRGYDMDRSAALQIMRLFARHELIVESALEFENFWRGNRPFANDARELMVKPGLTLYELIQSGPREAAKLVTFKELRNFVRTAQWQEISRRNRACCVHLREKMSRAFFRIWALGSMMQLTHWRLPLECCDMILDNSEMKNKDFYNICLAAEQRQ